MGSDLKYIKSPHFHRVISTNMLIGIIGLWYNLRVILKSDSHNSYYGILFIFEV